MDLRVIQAAANQLSAAFTKAMQEANESVHPKQRAGKSLQETHPALCALMDAITLVQMEVAVFGPGLEPHDEREGAPTKGFRKFVLIRSHDVTGVSGTGVIADGVQFTDGTVTLRWRGDTASTITYASADDALKVHGHGGHTRIMWIDGAAVLLEAMLEPPHEHEWEHHHMRRGWKICHGCNEKRQYTKEEVDTCSHTRTARAMVGSITGTQCQVCGGFKAGKENWRWVS
jgi:hypothetical protein